MCVADKKSAQDQCGKLHHFDFSALNSEGTAFANDQCTLKCVIDGKAISTNSIHEGAHCPTNSAGVSLIKAQKCWIYSIIDIL